MNNSIIKQEKIGSGAFGDVFKVTTADKEVYAVKTIKYIVDPKMIINEINILSRLQHPNIVRIYTNEKLNVEAFSMIMEFCPTDLRYCNSATCHGSPPGSFPYMAPEALKFPSEYSSKTDMYAIGIIAFEMFAKLDNSSCWKVIEELKKDPERVTYDHLACVNISPMDYKIIPQLLSADPQKRPSAGDLLANLSVGDAPESWPASGVLVLLCVFVTAAIVHKTKRLYLFNSLGKKIHFLSD